MDTLFFIASKIIWALISPETWIVLWVLWIALRPSRGRALGLLTFLVLLAALPSGDLLMRPLERHHMPADALPSHVDGIIVLGGAEIGSLTQHWGVPALNDSAERLTEAIYLARQYPDAQIVLSGGSGSITGQGLRGGGDMADVLLRSGVARDRLIIEGQSRNTYENAVYSKAMITPQDGQVWLLVTSAFHMPRSVAIFTKQDWHVTPWPVDFQTGATLQRTGWNLAQNLRQLNTGAKEWVGIVVYWATGRAVWPFT